MFKKYSEILIAESKKAIELGEVPISAIAVVNGEIIATAINNVERGKNKLAHAEMLLLENLQNQFKATHFFGMGISVFVSLEPCCMCCCALAMCGIENIYFLLEDKKFGGTTKVFQQTAYFKPNFYLTYNQAYEDLIKQFFACKR